MLGFIISSFFYFLYFLNRLEFTGKYAIPYLRGQARCGKNAVITI